MPQVPYNPVPNVALEGSTPKVSQNTPEAAFGGTIGSAIQGAGRSLEGAGDALFARSLEIQRLRLEGQVNDATTQAIEESAKGLEQYKLRLGNDAVDDDALDKQLQANKDIFKTARDSLPNDYARRMFDRQTLSSFRYADIHSAAHAWTEQKKATLASYDANEKLNEAQARKIPLWDNERFNTLLRDEENLAVGRAAARGQSPQELALHIFNRKSAMYAARARGINEEDPIAAQKFMTEHKTEISDQNWFSTARQVVGERRQVVSRNSSDNVNAHHEGPGYPPWMTPDERQKAESVLEPVNRVYRQFSIDSPEFRAQVTSGMRTPEHNRAVGGAPDSAHLAAPGTDLARGMDVVVKGDMAQAMAKIQDTANKIGIPIKFESLDKSKNHIHFQLADGFDPHSAPRAVPESETSRVKRGTDYASEHYPDDPDQGFAASTRIAGDYGHIKQRVRDQQQQYNTAISRAVLGEAGMPAATTPEEVKYRLEQAGQPDAWVNVDPLVRKGWERRMEAGQKDVSDAKRYRTLLDMGFGPDREKQKEFAFLNLASEPVSNSQLKTLQQQQTKIRGKPESDPRISAAMAVMPPGIMDGMSSEDKSDLRGRMVEQLQSKHDIEKAMPTDKDMVQMWKNMTFQQATEKSFLGYHYQSKDVPYFKKPLTEDEIQAEVPGLVRFYGRAPTREEAEKAARIFKYNERWGGSVSKEKTMPPQQQQPAPGQVPESK